jgi:hypothetical protein
MSKPAGARACDLEGPPKPWHTWQRDALHELLVPSDSVLELSDGRRSLTAALAARAGWVTVVEEDAERLTALRGQVAVCGWPNITLTSRLAAASKLRPFDVLVVPWLACDPPNLRWLCRLAERRVILHGALVGAALDDLRTSAQALGLDVVLACTVSGEREWRAVLSLSLTR